MLIALILWTLIVAGAWWFADAIIAFLTPGAAWLQANPDLAGWIEPTLGFLGSLGTSAAVIVWLAGTLLIALVSRRRPSAANEGRRTLSWEEWRRMDDGGDAPPPRRRDWSRRREDDYDDDRRRRRRRRDDDDDDDDED